MKKEITITVEVEEEPDKPGESEYPKRVVLGYSAGDEIELGGKAQTINSVSYQRTSEGLEFSVSTDRGLRISGFAKDVLPIIE